MKTTEPSSSPNGELAGLCRDLLPVWERHVQAAVSLSDEGVAGLLQQFSALRKLVLHIPEGEVASQAQLVMDQILTGFLFQDRASQMLRILASDMDRLHGCVSANDAHSLNAERWLQHLESQYVMDDQRDNHAGHVADPHLSGGADTTTYF